MVQKYVSQYKKINTTEINFTFQVFGHMWIYVL